MLPGSGPVPGAGGTTRREGRKFPAAAGTVARGLQFRPVEAAYENLSRSVFMSVFTGSAWRVACGALLLLSACAVRTVPIQALLDDPGRYDGETVRIHGEAKGGAGVLGYGAYQVDDGTGTLTVLSSTGGAPRSGAEVRVQGIFRAVATVGSTSVSVLEEEKRVD
jgi:hypothetical protein